jgi:hypothetical protein
MASTTSPRTTSLVECAECGVDKDVHDLDGCSSPEWQRVKVCAGCFERPDLCSC